MSIFSTFKSLFKNNSNGKDTSGEVTINEIDPILTNKTTIGLTPGEIILLDWCNGTLENKLFPQYFKYNYDVDGRKSVQKLINQEFLEYGSYNNQIESLKVKELKELLANNNLTSTGKKADLIKKIIESDIKVNNLPNSYVLTFKGRETVKDYEHIILAHKDKYFDVSNAIFYKNKLPYPYGYGDLKWAYLGNQTLEHTKNKEFGLLRNTYLAKADNLDTEKKYLNALSHYIVVVLLDASGLTNKYRYYRKPFYENVYVTSTIFEYIKKVIDKGSLTKEDYNSAFNNAIKYFSPLQALSLLSTQDLQFFKEEIYRLDHEVIENYLKKYENITHKKSLERQDEIFEQHSLSLEQQRKSFEDDLKRRGL